jgi:hypothetical protein
VEVLNVWPALKSPGIALGKDGDSLIFDRYTYKEQTFFKIEGPFLIHADALLAVPVSTVDNAFLVN